MRAILFLFLIFPMAKAYQLPTSLAVEDTKRILDRFGAAFVVKQPYYQKDEKSLKAFVHGSVSVIETSKIANLGSGTKDDPLNVSQFHFGLQLPFDLDFGIQTGLKTGAADIQQFGGFARWGFQKWGSLSFSAMAHGSGVNFENQMSVNLFGAMMGVELQMGHINLLAATGPLRVTSAFQPSLFGIAPADTVNKARQYSHQTFRLSFDLGDWNISGQTDWVKDFHSSAMIGASF